MAPTEYPEKIVNNNPLLTDDIMQVLKGQETEKDDIIKKGSIVHTLQFKGILSVFKISNDC